MIEKVQVLTIGIKMRYLVDVCREGFLWYRNYSYKRRSLGEALGGLNKVWDHLYEIKYENVHLSKKYAKVVDFSYCIMQVAFQNTLKLVKFFQCEEIILWGQFDLEHVIIDGRVEVPGEESHSRVLCILFLTKLYL